MRLVSGLPNVPDVSREGRYVAYRGETAQTETRIARVADGSDLEFALSGCSRIFLVEELLEPGRP